MMDLAKSRKHRMQRLFHPLFALLTELADMASVLISHD